MTCGKQKMSLEFCSNGDAGVDPGFWSRGQRSFEEGGEGPEPKISSKWVFPLKIPWYLHDFEKKNLAGKWGPGPQGPPGSACVMRCWIVKEDDSNYAGVTVHHQRLRTRGISGLELDKL